VAVRRGAPRSFSWEEKLELCCFHNQCLRSQMALPLRVVCGSIWAAQAATSLRSFHSPPPRRLLCLSLATNSFHVGHIDARSVRDSELDLCCLQASTSGLATSCCLAPAFARSLQPQGSFLVAGSLVLHDSVHCLFHGMRLPSTPVLVDNVGNVQRSRIFLNRHVENKRL